MLGWHFHRDHSGAAAHAESNYKPTYQDRVAPPGLSHTPRSVKSEIAYTKSNEETYRKYTESMAAFLKTYELERQTDGLNFEDCGVTPQTYKERGGLEDSELGQRKACRFDRKLLGVCSGIDDPHFGFNEGKPCLIVKLNRIVNFKPRAPTNNQSLPEALQIKSQPNLIPIYCKNKEREDESKIGEIKLLHAQYLQPLVAIQFTNLTLDEELRIECKVYGANIDYSEKDRYQGRFDVKFTIAS
ncbi:hypothetical protein KUCAC02_024827 [Chaenocephalus aceratus]|nr:hypothetical protein KUCAC02_024827 [Chaenocephalus aceratus]